MDGYRISHGLPQDARLALAARRAGVSRGVALAVWLFLLDEASRAVPRGVSASGAEEIAAALDLEASGVETLLAALRSGRLLRADGAICGWEKSQKLSTPRVRAHRARQRQEESDAVRRARLQESRQARHRQQGRLLAADTTLTPRRPL